MVVFETVDLIFSVHSEGHSIKALITDDTAETAGVVRLPEGLQDHVHDQMSTCVALVCRLLETRVQKVLFTENLPSNIVERLPSQPSTAGAAGKAAVMVEATHCLAGLVGSVHRLVALNADSKVVSLWLGIHLFFQPLSEGF